MLRRAGNTGKMDREGAQRCGIQKTNLAQIKEAAFKHKLLAFFASIEFGVVDVHDGKLQVNVGAGIVFGENQIFHKQFGIVLVFLVEFFASRHESLNVVVGWVAGCYFVLKWRNHRVRSLHCHEIITIARNL